jgi:hypothetical protein
LSGVTVINKEKNMKECIVIDATNLESLEDTLKVGILESIKSGEPVILKYNKNLCTNKYKSYYKNFTHTLITKLKGEIK